MPFNQKIPLFWWSSKKFEKKQHENFGDIIGPYLVKKISNKKVKYIQPKKRKWYHLFTTVYVTAGSILAQIDKNCIVWGSGIIDKNTKIDNAKFLAVRGPLTRKILIKQGYSVPKIYGDPAILLPKFYKPKLSKKYKIGIIPHYVDYDKVLGWYKGDASIKVIDLLNNNVEDVIDEIFSCENIISSSLHGIIVAHAYQIPAIWVKFSNKLFGDDIKFYDYFESVTVFNTLPISFNQKQSKQQLVALVKRKAIFIAKKTIEKLQNGLMSVCPF